MTNPFLLPPAEQLECAWQRFRREQVLDADVVPPPIAHSWQRCATRRLDWPTWERNGELEPSGETRALLAVVRPILEDLYQYIEGGRNAIAFANMQSIIVEVVGDQAAVADLARVGLAAGGAWAEEARGTNAFALALIEAIPILVAGSAHYCAELHPYFGAAAPIYDGLGLPVGAVGVVGQQPDGHPHSLGMVSAAAQAITNQLQTNLWLSSAHERLSELMAILQTLSEGIILLGRDSLVSHINARAGQLLDLAPAHVMGRRLRDLREIPPPLAQALAQGHDLHDEEIVFQIHGNRTPCVCTLKRITTTPAALNTLLSNVFSGPAGMQVKPSLVPLGSFVLSLRPIARVQRLIHRMTGARARMTFANIIGQSAAITEATRLARIAANSTTTVLLRGETGTGKELFAQSIHNGSSRAEGPFVAINCAAIPRELITSELFGYEGGAFTGADRQGRPGKFELAHGGTLFLDEIGDMPRDLQTSLLRALETRTITRIGGQQVISVDVRIIAATHKPLEAEVSNGAFRSDLFYRLNVFAIAVPSLRERSEDVPALMAMMLRRHSETLGHALTMTPEALDALTRYDWPGNIRELENTIERLVYVAEGGMLRLSDLPLAIQAVASQPGLLAAAPERLVGNPTTSLRYERSLHEAEAIRHALATCDGKIDAAARLLGISRTTLWRRREHLKQQGLIS